MRQLVLSLSLPLSRRSFADSHLFKWAQPVPGKAALCCFKQTRRRRSVDNPIEPKLTNAGAIAALCERTTIREQHNSDEQKPESKVYVCVCVCLNFRALLLTSSSILTFARNRTHQRQLFVLPPFRNQHDLHEHNQATI